MLVQLVESVLTYTLNKRLLRQGQISKEGSRAASDSSLPDEHVLLGHLIPRNPEIVTLSPEARRRHLYLLGATGTGKTNLMLRLIESDIAHGRTFCVVDLRGDLIDRVLVRLAQGGDAESLAKRTLLLDLRQEEYSVGFNPLAGAGDPYSRAFHVLSVLHQQSDSWGVQLEETLRNCLIVLATTGGTLLEIDSLLHRPLFRQAALSRVADNQVHAFFERYGRLSEDRQMTWSLPVMNKITPLLAIPRLRHMFGQRQSIPFHELLDHQPGSILLISLAVDRLQQAAYLVGSLLVSAFQATIMARVDQPEKQRVPVHLYVDEFETMATEQFETIIAEGRRFGLGLCLSHQNLSQLSVSLRHVLRNNVHTQMYFQTGALDAAELAQEITTGDPREVVRTTLMTQQIGEAYLVRRGQPAARLRLLHSPDPAADPDILQAMRMAALGRYARLRADIERDMEQIEQRSAPSEQYRAPGTATLEGSPPRETEIPNETTDKSEPESGNRRRHAKKGEVTYEIRHAPVQPKLNPEKPSEQFAEIESGTEQSAAGTPKAIGE